MALKLFRSTNSNSASSLFSNLQTLTKPKALINLSVSLCTQAQQASRCADSLYNRVLASNPALSVLPVLNSWIDEQKSVEKRELQSMIKMLKSHSRFSHALEVSTWMTERRFFPLSSADVAYRLELIAKVKGIHRTENYFDNLAVQLKDYKTYNALLGCFAEEKSVEKAESLFRKMKELNICTSYSYNMIIKLYSITNQLDKVNLVFQEMQESEIRPDRFTFDFLIEAFCDNCDIMQMESYLEKLNGDYFDLLNWHIYASVGKAYFKAGLLDKGLEALKKSEGLIVKKKGQVGYGCLQSIYAEIGRKDEMFRVWEVCKSSERASNSMYMCMISLLIKFDDLEGAEKVFKEWESVPGLNFLDFRVPNLLIRVYVEKGLLEKAENLLREITEKGRKPYANTWDTLASAYFKDKQNLKGFEMTKRALVEGNIGWKPNMDNIVSSLVYCMMERKVEEAEEIVRFSKRLMILKEELHRLYCILLKVYLVAGLKSIDLMNRMRADGFRIDEETRGILESGL